MRIYAGGLAWHSTAPSVLLAALLWVFLTPAQAQQEPIDEIGKQEFLRSCAACHGETARGDGLVAGLLLVKPPDLTSIRKRHGGQFPASWVYRIIDGRAEMRPHEIFAAMTPERAEAFFGTLAQESPAMFDQAVFAAVIVK